LTPTGDKTGKYLSRTQLPLTLAWAITIHKSQGLTLKRVVIDLGQKDFSAGLSFVAISRVKKLDGIAFRTSFPWSRLQRPNVTEPMKMLEEDTSRRAQLGFKLDTYGMDLSQYVFDD
jgi:ATP-dependent exoDNAse (exonuclease V) alpha subunit